MPLYYKEHSRGYDLDGEREFFERDGVRYILGSAGSFIWVCPTCGEEHFRSSPDPAHPENCFQDHGPMELLTSDNIERYLDVWRQGGSTIITVEERRAERLAKERENPWRWQFGEKTEADYPLGYVKSSIEILPGEERAKRKASK